MLKLPPRVWHSLWCSPIATWPSTAPHSQAPYSASCRARASRALACSAGSARASAAMPSSAISAMIGFGSGVYSPSAACAIAFRPLVMESGSGKVIVSSGSYTTVFGSTRTSRPVFLTPPSVRP
jgi:hypothetical protein